MPRDQERREVRIHPRKVAITTEFRELLGGPHKLTRAGLSCVYAHARIVAAPSVNDKMIRGRKKNDIDYFSNFHHLRPAAFIDEVAHLGEFVCLMRQMDMKPSYINWINLHSKTA